ncbi:hypothetical protein AAF712_005691 [Marasmius tenuissimus]|uniref:Uncharacterized protein n=1 Tax=Marasmius tenuissimus TaxID=585030 RepID=A0ABR3A2N4_9AGAR
MSTTTVRNPRANAQAASSSNQTKAPGASSRPPATSTPASRNAGVSKNTQPNTSALSNTNPAPETVKTYLGKPSNSDSLAATRQNVNEQQPQEESRHLRRLVPVYWLEKNQW